MKLENISRTTLVIGMRVCYFLALCCLLAMVFMPLFDTPAYYTPATPRFEMIQDVVDEPLPPAWTSDVPMEIPPVITEDQDIEPLPPEVQFDIDSELVPEPVELEILDIDF